MCLCPFVALHPLLMNRAAPLPANEDNIVRVRINSTKIVGQLQ